MADRKYSFLYEHRGMLQTDRQALAPQPGSMRVSGLRFEDLVRRSAEFAGSVIFYGDDNKVRGDWNVFFSQIYDKENRRVRTEVIDEMVQTSSVPPHLALLFAFYQMLLVEQEDLNHLTDRQLEFYFRDILGFEIEKGSEGPVTVFAELAKNNAFVSIPQGMLFDAGKDASGASVIYACTDELRLGREDVALFARYADESGFETVGGDAPGRTHAVCVCSRIFGLTGGTLTVTIGDDSVQESLDGLDAEYTSAEGWTPAGKYGSAVGLTIDIDKVPMAPYDPLVHGEGMDTPYPVIRLVSTDGMAAFAGISPSSVRTVRVTQENGLPLRVENKYGPVENRSGVNPFGYECRKDDWFRVVLPFPASALQVSVEMNEKVYKSVPDETCLRSPAGVDRLKYAISGNECDQELISRDYSLKLIQIMKQETLEEEEIKKALDGSLMAVSPRLVLPVTVRKACFADTDASVFLAHPCGIREVAGWESLNEAFRLSPPGERREAEETAPSALYIAFSHADLDRGQLSLYIRMDSQAKKPDARTTDRVKEPGRVGWFFMSGGNWKKFSESRILRDTTCGLSQDGTVVLDYQDRLEPGGCGFQGGYTWIKGECDNANCLDVTDILSRAIELSYDPSSKGAGPAGAALPAGTITKTVGSIVGLKKISQPFDGLAGTKAEDPGVFRRRVAESLRHKGRAWSVWDYESLVLRTFPEVVYAKCLPSCDKEGNVAPGVVTMVVIPEISDDDLVPHAGVRLVNRVKEELRKVCSPFVDIRIVNPSYRRVKVMTGIALRKGFNDPVRYEALVSDALLVYLRSWKGYADGSHFMEGMGVSDIIAFLESLPFVDVVESIEVALDGQPVKMDGNIRLDTPVSVITSADAHEVRCHTAN